MERKRFHQIILTFFLLINISIVTSNTFRKCPEGYIFYTDGLCYPEEQKPKIPESNQFKTCPEGYILYTDNLCYPIETKPCPFEDTTTAPLTTTTLRPPLEVKEYGCPRGSVMLENKCRKIICSLGEYYRGDCLQPVCPSGLVWRGKICQKPGYMTTILEIDNVFLNQINEKPIKLETSNNQEVVYHTSTSTTTTTQKPPTTRSSTVSTTTTKYQPTNLQSNITTCCQVVSPRICKLYGVKWLCFNRKHTRCDSRICSSPVVYLKPPEIKYEAPVLVMPPNPKLNGCTNSECYNNFTTIDCSGCASVRSENCSPHCYRYTCPKETCAYLDLSEYCSYYTGQNGCLPVDGCLWNWC